MEFGPKIVELRDGRKVELRSVRESDAPAVLQFTHVLAGEPGLFIIREPHELDTTPDKIAKRATEHLAHPGKLWIGAFDCARDGAFLGVIRGATHDLARISHVCTLNIGLYGGARGVGLGRRMMQEAIAAFRENPAIRRIVLSVVATNAPAIGLYKGMGFVEEGRRLGEIRTANGIYEDDIIMALNLVNARS